MEIDCPKCGECVVSDDSGWFCVRCGERYINQKAAAEPMKQERVIDRIHSHGCVPILPSDTPLYVFCPQCQSYHYAKIVFSRRPDSEFTAYCNFVEWMRKLRVRVNEDGEADSVMLPDDSAEWGGLGCKYAGNLLYAIRAHLRELKLLDDDRPTDDAEPLEPPDVSPQCAKCGARDAEVKYHTGRFGECTIPGRYISNPCETPHLHYYCKNCGYDWVGPTKDGGE